MNHLHQFEKNAVRIFIGFFILLTMLAYVKIIYVVRPLPSTKKPFLIQQEFGRELYMTVFIHGTFHTGLSFLSYMPLAKDSFKDSTYKYVMQKIRNDPLFYQSQPILGLGLHKLEPTLDAHLVSDQRLMAYPIIQMYQEVAERTAPGKEKNIFYCFGWPGFVSKATRRIQAVYLYNALQEEQKRYQAQGLQPKIRLITFSHGGNVALNLAAITTILDPTYTKSTSPNKSLNEYQEALNDMRKLCARLPSMDIAKKNPQKNPYKYAPHNQKLTIDELVLLGVPIQPETDHFCHAPCFKKIYNFYSDEDAVQSIDWISSKKPYANQRIDIQETGKKIDLTEKNEQIIQAQILVGRTLNELDLTNTKLQEQRKKYQAVENAPWWKRFFYRGNLISKKSADPTHREFWFTYWNRQGDLAFLNPFPVVVLVPLICSTLQKVPNLYDADVNIIMKNQNLSCQAVTHHQLKILSEHTINALFLHEAQAKMERFRPDPNTKKQEFETLKKHVDDFLR